MDIPELNRLADRLFGSFESHDLDSVAAMCAPDAIVTQNGRTASWAEFRPGLEALLTWFGDHRYEKVRRVFGTNTVVEEHQVVSTTTDGKAVDLAACVILRFDDEGRLTSLDEYVDTSSLLN